jgi:hypothetical protein
VVISNFRRKEHRKPLLTSKGSRQFEKKCEDVLHAKVIFNYYRDTKVPEMRKIYLYMRYIHIQRCANDQSSFEDQQSRKIGRSIFLDISESFILNYISIVPQDICGKLFQN